MTRKLAALVLTLGMFYTAFADTFIVTSNADTGPGTLREAIEKANANGTSESDFISFNLHDISFSARTIRIQSRLPNISSNIIIDGSSQTGVKFGVSDAKIKIIAPSIIKFTVFKFVNSSNIHIYGLYIVQDYNYIDEEASALSFNNCKDVFIGEPGKGNMINTFKFGILCDSGYSNNFSIKSNIMGYDSSGSFNKSIRTLWKAIFFSNASTITIGGPDIESRNFISGSSGSIEINSSLKQNGSIKIENNYLDIDYSGTRMTSSNSTQSCTIYSAPPLKAAFDILIKDNVITGGISLIGIASFFKVIGNKIGINPHTFSPLSTIDNDYHFSKGIYIAYCGKGIVGGSLESEKNYITRSGFGVLVSDSPKIQITKNSIFCNGSEGGIYFLQGPGLFPVPFININKIENYIDYSGTATPNSKIEFFIDDSCMNCEGKIYVGTTTSDERGVWSYQSPVTANLVATATTSDSSTSEFSKPVLNLSNVQLQHPTCGKNNGAIYGVKIISGTNFKWLNNNRKVISTDTSISNLTPGNYTLVVSVGEGACSREINYTLNNIQIPQDLYPSITPSSCGRANGSIYIRSNINGFNSKWQNTFGDSLGTGPFLNGLLPGMYYIKLWLQSDTSCNQLYGPFEIKNLSGPTLNINSLLITNAICGNNNGSIKNITGSNVTGTPFIQWLDSVNNVVGNSLNLANVPAGKYRLKFKDQSNCDTITTPYYTIANAGVITIDTAQLKITSSECAYASGTIKDIIVTGATQYQWTNLSGETISRELNPGFLYSGKYVLTVSNQYGCEKRTNTIIVPTYPYMGFTTPLEIDRKPGRCDLANGYIHITNFPKPENYTFRWMDSTQNNIIGTQLYLENFNSGTFYLYAKDAEGCEQKALTAVLRATPSPKLNEVHMHVTDDLCSQQIGKIEGIQLQQGTGSLPLTYMWIDAQNHIISNEQNLIHHQTGTYRLIVQDRLGCRDSSNWHTIPNQTKNYAAPKYNDITILRNTSATLTPINTQLGTYQLYSSPTATVPIQENNTGAFITDILSVDKTFYVKIKTGACESELTPIQVKAVDETKVFVPNAFSPNHDGKNETLKPVVFGLLELEYFIIYDRWSNIVFKSNNINSGWDGFYKNMESPAGVYIWILKGKDIKGNTINQKGTSLLIR